METAEVTKRTLFCKNKSIKIPAGNHMFKVNNRNTRITCEICSK